MPRNARIKFLVSIILLLSSCTAFPSLPVYEVRGIVARIDQTDRGYDRVQLLHEAIPSFRDRTGKESGMDVMIMPFAFEPQTMPFEIIAGDKLHIEFEVRWNETEKLWIRSAEKLNQETELNLEGYELEE